MNITPEALWAANLASHAKSAANSGDRTHMERRTHGLRLALFSSKKGATAARTRTPREAPEKLKHIIAKRVPLAPQRHQRTQRPQALAGENNCDQIYLHSLFS